MKKIVARCILAVLGLAFAVMLIDTLNHDGMVFVVCMMFVVAVCALFSWAIVNS